MVKARMSAAEWEKIKSESGIVEHNGEAGRPQPDEDVVEPVSMPKKNPTKIGTMQPAAKGGKLAGEVTEWKSHEGYDASADTFEGRHPTLAKAVDIGKKAVGVVNKKSAEYIKNVQKSDEKFKEMEGEREEEEPEEKPSKKKSKKKSKGKMIDEEDFDDEDEDITALHKSTSKQKVLPGDYKPAYGSGMGKKGYEPVYTASMGAGTYQPAYKSKVSEMVTAKPTTEQPTVTPPQQTRYNVNNWQSLGFPNTLPQNARGSLFRPAQQPQPQQVVPMVRQPYQPQPQQTPMPQRRAPMSGPMPRMALNITTTPQIMKPRTTVAPPRAPMPTHTTTAPMPAPITFMGVTLGEKKKQEPKPITKMGEGYKNTPIYLMNSFYPSASYNPNKDPIIKKSIIPKIHATVSPHDFTMFGARVKNRKI